MVTDDLIAVRWHGEIYVLNNKCINMDYEGSDQ